MRGAEQVRAKRVRIAVLLRLSHGNDCATNTTVSFLTNENGNWLSGNPPRHQPPIQRKTRLGPQ